MERIHTLVQRGLISGDFTLISLGEKYGIKAVRHKKYPNLVLLKYDQIESPMSEPVVQECRGMILDEADGWKCIARPFDKFFNYGEGHAAPIDWKNAVVQEKVDGSLITMYYYANEWHVATSGTPDASGQVNGEDFTFADLFWKTWKEAGYKIPDYSAFCHMFELTSHYNRVVVRHPEPKITWIGTRAVDDGRELFLAHPDVYAAKAWPPKVRSFPLGSLEEIVATFEHIDPLSQEGYVVVSSDPATQKLSRQKVKHPGYIAIHQARDGMSSKSFVEVIRTGESPEFELLLKEFPEWEPKFNEIRSRYNQLVSELEAVYTAIKHIPVQKDFALCAVKSRWPSALFELRKGGVPSIKAHLARVNIKHMMDNLKVKEIDL